MPRVESGSRSPLGPDALDGRVSALPEGSRPTPARGLLPHRPAGRHGGASEAAVPAPRGAQDRSLRANFSWALLGNAVYAASQWGIVVLLAKLGNPEMVGVFALGIAVTGPIVLLSNLSLRSAQASDAQRLYSFGDYLAVRLLTSLLAIGIIAGVASSYSTDVFLVILGIGIAKAIESISDIIFGLLQQHERLDRTAISMVLKGPLSLAAVSLMIVLTGNVFWGVIGMAASWTLLLVGYDIPQALRILGAKEPCQRLAAIRPSFDYRLLWQLIAGCLPLGIVSALISLSTNIPRYFVEHHLGRRELGVFAALAYLIAIGTQVTAALGQAAIPRLARHFANQDLKAFRRVLLRMVGIAVCVGVTGFLAALVAGPTILRLLYTEEYSQCSSVFVVLMAAAALLYVGGALAFGATATRNYYRFLLPYVGLVAIVALASLWLIPRWGLLGAAWSVFVMGIGTCAAPLAVLRTAFRSCGPGPGSEDLS